MAALPSQARAKSNLGSAIGDRGETQAQPRVDFIAVTQNDELLEQLGQALDGESAIRHADTVAAARELIHASQGCVVMLDAREHTDPAKVLELLQSPSGLSVLVVFAPADQTNSLAQAIKRSATFAVLPVPIETAKTAAVLEGAREEALARRSVVSEPVQAHAPAARSAPSSAAPHPARMPRSGHEPEQVTATHHGADGPTRGGPPRAAIVGVVAGVAMLLAVGAWYFLRGSDETETASAVAPVTGPAEAPVIDASAKPVLPLDTADTPAVSGADATPAPTPAIVPGSIEMLLEKAQVAFRERRFTDPEKDNALVYYRSVLAQEPDNGEALEALTRISAVLDARLQTAITEQRYDEAAATLADLKLINPGDARLRATEGKLAEARIAAALRENEVDRAAAVLRQASQSGVLSPDRMSKLREDVERRQAAARVQRLGELVTARIREDRLVEPANDSAKYYLAQLRKAGGDSRRAVTAQRELENAVLQQAREAAVARQAAESERWLDEARSMGVSRARITALQRETRAAATVKPAASSDAERLASLVRERTSDGRLLEPAQDSAFVHLAALRLVDPAAAATASAALSVRLIDRGRTSLAAGRVDDAERHVSAARQLGVNLPEVETLELNIGAARAPLTPEPVQVTADQLKRTRYIAPEYPRQALAKEMRGEVKVRYMVGTDGRVKDAVITSSNPSGVFDEVALAAVRRWRFKPHEVGGQPVEAVSGTVMVFQPDDGAKR